MLDALAHLARVASVNKADLGDVVAACRLVAEALPAQEAYVVRPGDPYYTRVGDDTNPDSYEIKQKGYWLVWRELADGENDGVLFDVTGRFAEIVGPVRPGVPCTHIACSIPSDEDNSEILVVRGPWPAGLNLPQVNFLVAAIPIIAGLAASVMDQERRQRQAKQLGALSDVAKAFSGATEMENVLQSVATALAKASDYDWVTITLVNEDCSEITEREGNLARFSDTQIATTSSRNRLRSLELRNLELAKIVGETGKPVLVPDLLAPERQMPEDLRAYYQRAHLVSSVTFPILFQEKVLGTVNFSSSRRRDLEAELSFLGDLVLQAATAIKGVSLFRELEEARRIEHFLARTDALTGLPNRRYIEEVIRAEFARVRRYAKPLSLIMADLDRFKLINDTHGHLTGDEVLKHVARLAREASREADFVGRWGGDEFLFILPETDIGGAANFAERFRATVAAAEIHAGLSRGFVRVCLSAGIAHADPENARTPDEVVGLADAALYEAKESGRNRSVRADRRRAAA